MTGNCLFDPFLLKYIHIYTYCIKKAGLLQTISVEDEISWERGSQVPRHYPTLDESGSGANVTVQSHDEVHDVAAEEGEAKGVRCKVCEVSYSCEDLVADCLVLAALEENGVDDKIRKIR